MLVASILFPVQGRLDSGVSLIQKPFSQDVLASRVRKILSDAQQALSGVSPIWVKINLYYTLVISTSAPAFGISSSVHN
jgi:DNA-binding response OmpR family regulator